MVKTVKVRTSRGDIVLVDADDLPIVGQHSWHLNCYGYAKSKINYKHILMHRMIMGDIPSGMVIDHINGNKLDNRKANLRVCTQGQNATNCSKRSRNKKYKGVYLSYGGKFRAKISKDGIDYCLGSFTEERDAAKAYNDKAIELFGKYARVNPL